MSEGAAALGLAADEYAAEKAAAAAGADTAKIAEAKWRRAKTVDDVRAKHKGQPSRRR